MSEFKKWFKARARNPDKITLEEAFEAGMFAQPAPSVPDGVAEALQRLIENGAVLGPASSEDALLVARYRQRILACAPSINEGVRKVTLDFRWDSEAQHHIPTIEIEFEPVSPNDAKGWQDRDRLAAMLTPEAQP